MDEDVPPPEPVTKTSNNVVTHSGLKRPEGTYKPRQLGGSDWFTYGNSSTSYNNHDRHQQSPARWVLVGYFVSVASVRLIDICMFSIKTSKSRVAFSPHNHCTISASDSSSAMSTGGSVVSFLVGAFAPCLLGPMWEELLYRGFLLPATAHVFPVVSSIFMTSALFALHHAQLETLLPLFALSVVWSAVYILTADLRISTSIHILWNCRPLVHMVLHAFMSVNWGPGSTL